jgi:exosortase
MGIEPQTWGRVFVVTALFVWLFWHNLVRLWLKTNPFTGEPNWSHAVCVPIIGLYYLYIHREELIKAQATQFIFGRFRRPWRAVAAAVMIAVGVAAYLITNGHSGLAISMVRGLGVAMGVYGVLVLILDWSIATMFFGLAMFVYGINPGRNDYLCDLGMVITLFGVVLLLCGWNVMKIAWFPIVFLIVALPWPGLVYSWVAEPLSQLAAQVAVHVLQLTGVESLCSGTKIIIANADPTQPARILNVAEACAGMRSLMTFIAVAGAVAFLSSRPLWQKVIVVASAIPIAILCNVMRISGQGLLDHYVSTEWSESFAHQFVGMIMLLPAFFLILFVGYLLDKMFIEEAEEGEVGGPIISRPVSAIATRQELIPAVGTMSSIASPATISAAPIVNRPSAAPSVRTAQIGQSPVVNKPVQPQPTRSLAGATPPRPVTAANPRPRAAVSPRSPANPNPPKMPASPQASPARVVKPAIGKPPANKPPSIKPKESM